MVEYSRLGVNEYQITVDDCFLNFEVISIGKIRNNQLNIEFISFRKRYFYSTIFYITQ